MEINARGMHYRQLNEMVRVAALDGETKFDLLNVNGQRYIGSGLSKKVRISIQGIPGNDLGSFLDGSEIYVAGNAQDAIGNTMNDGKVVVRGSAGDVLGYAMRGGKIFIGGNAGYRVGIHMKEYRRQVPWVIVGGTAGDFFGEYMAGGVMVLLGLERQAEEPLAGGYLGTGMHGGVIYLRGTVESYNLGKEVSVFDLTPDDEKFLDRCLKEYCQDLELNLEMVRSGNFCKLLPVSSRPYGKLYVY